MPSSTRQSFKADYRVKPDNDTFLAKNSTFDLEYFDIKNLPLVVDVVVPLWSPPIGDKEFKRFNVEYIVRMNMFDNDLNYQLVDAEDGTLLSSAFLAKKEM